MALTRANRAFNVKLVAFLDEVLFPDSAQRFAQRVRSTEDPIELGQIRDIVQFLVARYSDRPTQPSAPSQNGHGGTGETSTVTALSTESTPSTSTESGS